MKYSVPRSESEDLPNLLGLTDPLEIGRLETLGFALAEENLAAALHPGTRFTVRYIRDIHYAALGPLYAFAGKYRTVNLSKGGFSFPPARYLEQSMETFEQEILRTLPFDYKSPGALAAAAGAVHAELLYIHPFREGNGRTARLLANLMAAWAGYSAFRFERLISAEGYDPDYIRAVKAAAVKDYKPMAELFLALLREAPDGG